MRMTLDELFLHVYVNNNFDDPHKVFASYTGMSRQEAKLWVYRKLYSSDFLRTWKENVQQ